MERKNIVSLMAIVAFVAAVIFAGCVEEGTSVSTPSPEVATATPTTTIVTFSGSGYETTPIFWLERRVVTFKMSHDEDIFAVYLLDREGNIVSNLACEFEGPHWGGKMDGSKAVAIRKQGYYMLDINANGNWTITFEQLRA